MPKFTVRLLMVGCLVGACAWWALDDERGAQQSDRRSPSSSREEIEIAKFLKLHDDLGVVIDPEHSIADLARTWTESRQLDALDADSRDGQVREIGCPACGLDHAYEVDSVAIESSGNPKQGLKAKNLFRSNIPTH
jgi:hypothetical protein